MADKSDHEEHVKFLLRGCNKYEQQYNSIRDYAYGGTHVYFFNLGNLVGPITVKRIFLWKGNVFNTGMFLPIYVLTQDRIMTYKYWGQHKDFFREFSNKIVKYDKSLICHSCGICDYNKSHNGNVLSNDKLLDTYGTYWLFSLSLPFNENNIFRGNIYIYVGQSYLTIFKIYHTYASIDTNGKYLDINLNFRNINLDNNIEKNLLTYLLVKRIIIERTGEDKCKISNNNFLIEYNNEKGGYYNKLDIKSRIILMILRSIYVTELDNDDFLKICSFQEFKNIIEKFSKFIQKVNSSPIKMNIHIQSGNDIEEMFSFNYDDFKIRIFVADNRNNIIFVHPELTSIAFENEQLYTLLVNKILKDEIKRKKLLNLFRDNTKNIVNKKEELIKIINDYNVEYKTITVIIQKLKRIYTSRLLNKV